MASNNKNLLFQTMTGNPFIIYDLRDTLIGFTFKCDIP